ncbi:MAG TPA: phosphoribosyltransferase family protein [Chitinophagaceae bacterium]|nr:ComF family protein [Chitinophagaceae bacterium]MCC6634534.1 ComF family protein [Chitinophagaceae bacterium]HMZ45474.1 phosphoribosyltransferase family protein [Chitinophagaceae bacterium]HNF29853.1 phosphoribosyltransferase family protein [Chitinophagaceae bacterium]HNM35097.1 phosphoribosyltransferase family protein [Chitinophagaceae bacterium]
MLFYAKTYLADFLHLIFPNYCEGCGTDNITEDHFLCIKCIAALPVTGFENVYENTIEKMFYGRLNLQYATAGFYFSKQTLMQHLMHQLKYKGNKEAGLFLGKMLGLQLLHSDKFKTIDAIIPMPISSKKIVVRGYNQAEIISQGITMVFNKPILKNVVVRIINSKTQTKQNRVERWENMKGVFEIKNKIDLEGKHILLVDDIVTTGATLEACGKVILQNGNCTLSIATVAYTL